MYTVVFIISNKIVSYLILYICTLSTVYVISYYFSFTILSMCMSKRCLFSPCCCCLPTTPFLFRGVLPYFEVTGIQFRVPDLDLSVRIVSFGTVAILSILQK